MARRKLSSARRYTLAKRLLATDTVGRGSRKVFYNTYVTMRTLKVCHFGRSNARLAAQLAALADSVVMPSWHSYYRAPIYRFNK